MANGAFECTLRVYFEDTDAGGVVFYANYLKFFERARTEWLRSAGIGQQRMRDETGLMFAVRRTAVEYHQAARLDDLLLIVSRIERIGGASAEFYQEAWRVSPAADVRELQHEPPRELLASCRIKVACVRWHGGGTREGTQRDMHQEKLRPAPIPGYVRDALTPQTPQTDLS